MSYLSKILPKKKYGHLGRCCGYETVSNDNRHSPDCSGNPFLKKKIATKSGKKLLKKIGNHSVNPNSLSLIYRKMSDTGGKDLR